MKSIKFDIFAYLIHFVNITKIIKKGSITMQIFLNIKIIFFNDNFSSD